MTEENKDTAKGTLVSQKEAKTKAPKTTKAKTPAKAKTESTIHAGSEQPPKKETRTKNRLEKAKQVAERHGVKILHENRKGEYFTEWAYAVASEAGKIENVTTHKFD